MNNQTTPSKKEIGFEVLDQMPLPIAILKIEVDEQGDPMNLFVLYTNRALQKFSTALASLPATTPFYTAYPDLPRKWLYACWKTAHHGISQKFFGDFGGALPKAVSVSCYQPAPGLCGCIFQDIQHQLNAERNQYKLNIVLQNSVDYLFDFDLTSKTFSDASSCLGRHPQLPTVANVPLGLVKEGLLRESSQSAMEDMIQKISEGFSFSSCVVEFRPHIRKEFQWYRISLHPYNEKNSQQVSFVGFMKNIHAEMLQQQRLETVAGIDELTQIHNLHAGKQMIHDLLLMPCPQSQGNTFFLFDIDNFKAVNDLHGHYTGDLVLKKFAQLLTDVFRKTDVIYRMGGDEFIVFAPQASSEKFIHRTCQQIIESAHQLPGLDFSLSVSIGIAVSMNPQARYEDFYQTADKALYSVKKSKKGKFFCLLF